MKLHVAFAAIISSAAPALAEGDIEAGAVQFNRQCVACHVARDDAGEIIAGRSGKAGPNLYGVAGRKLAASQGFRYGDSIIRAGQLDLVWSEENFVTYVQDPTDWLRRALDDRRARSKMGYKVRSQKEAQDIYAYLESLVN